MKINRGGAQRNNREQNNASATDKVRKEAEKLEEENRRLREELKMQQENTIRSEAECSAYRSMHEQLLKKIMERRE